MRIGLVVIVMVMTLGCATSQPRNVENLCDIFDEKGGWYKDAKRAAKKWDSDISILMAFIRRESAFVSNAKPPRRKLLGFIPGPRLSDAYGDAQVKDDNWKWYEREEGGIFASRNDFEDAVDFIGWYNKQSAKRCRISTRDPYKLYLAYHEGQGGYNRGSYKNKKHVKEYARKVAKRASVYKAQLKKCEDRLNRPWWWIF